VVLAAADLLEGQSYDLVDVHQADLCRCLVPRELRAVVSTTTWDDHIGAAIAGELRR
jgi:hypothetical protein